MAKILLIDTLYDSFIKSLPFNPAGTYESELRSVLDESFGTADFYSRHLKALGWDAVDIIANHAALQELWALSRPGWFNGDRLEAQIASFDPDVVFSQDLSLPIYKHDRLLAGQCSCPWPGDDKVRNYDVIFTSFPHYLERIQNLGVRAEFLPLAFEPSMLDKIGPRERDIDISFVGGVGANSHWHSGTEFLEGIARHFGQRFHWFGYGLQNLSQDSPLRACYRGEAWGNSMYEVYARSKCVVNRHGEVSQNHANNLRLFESTGMGSLLVTERFLNLPSYFSATEVCGYSTIEEACYALERFLQNEPALKAVAAAGQRRTLRDHTYKQRMAKVSEVLTGMLCPA